MSAGVKARHEPGFWVYVERGWIMLHVFLRRFEFAHGNGGWSWGITLRWRNRYVVSRGHRAWNEPRDCYCCGLQDDRTRLGSVVCISCFSLTTCEQRTLQTERAESQDVEGYVGRKAA